jgi:hypothetical protein
MATLSHLRQIAALPRSSSSSTETSLPLTSHCPLPLYHWQILIYQTRTRSTSEVPSISLFVSIVSIPLHATILSATSNHAGQKRHSWWHVRVYIQVENNKFQAILLGSVFIHQILLRELFTVVTGWIMWSFTKESQGLKRMHLLIAELWEALEYILCEGRW